MLRTYSIAAVVVFSMIAGAAGAQEPKRTELQRRDLTGTNMEIIVTMIELPPGASVPRHIHYGEEVFYVLDGGSVEMPGQQPVTRAAGASGINVREVPHAGFKVVGDKTMKLLTVHIVDKGKPLQVPAP